MPRLLAIELENFQSIKERTRIDFSAITLLYGPNSAGKSAIFDALELIECVWDPNKFNEKKLSEMIGRWARKENKKILPCVISVEYQFDEENDPDAEQVWFDQLNWKGRKTPSQFPLHKYWEEFNAECEFNFLLSGKALIKLEITFLWGEMNGNQSHLISGIHIEINNRPILTFLKANKYPWNEGVGELSIYNNRGYAPDAVVIFPDPSLASSKEAKHISQRNGECVYSGYFSVDKFDVRSFKSIYEEEPPGDLATVEHISSLASDILFYLGTIIGGVFRKSTPLVKADRRVPSPREVLTIVDPGLENWWEPNHFSPETPAKLISELSRDIDPHYAIIARSAHAEIISKTSKNVFWGDSHSQEHLKKFSSESVLVERINKHLESRLFHEKLYRLKCSSTLMVPIDLDQDDPWSYYALSQPSTVRLYLEDGESRETELHDVGSGVPFVLPVLCAAVHGGLVRIQQPELHLHPALQSSIADVFIEEILFKDSNLFIIETHSEHLLLRLLRRIRDKEKKCETSHELPLNPSDIAIYYFDPQVTGGTVVTRQLITPLGDFYSEWPRGFFSDRDRDLFDV